MKQSLPSVTSLDDIPGLTPQVRDILDELTTAAPACIGDALDSIVLYGSAAEGKLRATSDVNLLFVLSAFSRERIDPLREALRRAHAVALVKVMFVLQSELAAAADSFAMKFDDITHRHLVLFGEDPFANVTISRQAKIDRLRQVLLNLAIRLRERYAMTSLREEQLTLVVADTAGPLRVAAATILELQGTPAASAKEALEHLAPALGVDGWQETLAQLSAARETRMLPPGVAAKTTFAMMQLTDSLRRMAERL